MFFKIKNNKIKRLKNKTINEGLKWRNKYSR